MSEDLRQTPDLFRAFADPTRLRLLNLLSEGDCCVCHLCEVIGASQPKVSRHLAYLRRAGLVRARREGKWMWYSIAREVGGVRRSLLQCVSGCLRETDVLRRDLKRLRRRSGKETVRPGREK